MKDNIYLILGIVLLVAAFLVSWAITEAEFNDEVVYSNRVVKAFPTFGFDNFFADINWIKLIQIKNPENKTENFELASQKYSLLDRITSLNPHMSIAYIKTIDLMFVKDREVKEQALSLFERGTKYNARKTWKVDYFSAFTCASIADDIEEDDAAKTRYLNKAHMHIKEAKQMPNCPRFIDRMEAHFIKRLNKPIALIEAWINLYQSAESDYDRKTCYYNMKAVYHESLNMLNDLEGSETTEDVVMLKKLSKKVAQLKGVIFKDSGHCSNVKCPYLAQKEEFYVGQNGEKFCPHCGTGLEFPANKVVCTNKSCGVLLERSANFCPFCGTGVPKDDDL